MNVRFNKIDAFHDYVNAPKNTHPHNIYVNELYINHIIVIEMDVPTAHDTVINDLSVKSFNFVSGFTHNF
jgi:hypothetical protein